MKYQNYYTRDKCSMCGKTETDPKKLKTWDLQHLHFSDADIKFLTCDECKKIDPMKWLDKIMQMSAVH